MNPQEQQINDSIIVKVVKSDSIAVDSLVVIDSLAPPVIRRPLLVKVAADTVHLPDTISRFNTKVITGKGEIGFLPPGFEPLRKPAYTAITDAGSLKEGLAVPVSAFRNDWTIILLFSTVIMLLLVRLFGKGQIGSVFLSLLPRSIKGGERMEKQYLFHWSEIIFNLMAFINISLFSYFLSVNYGFSPPGSYPVISWLIILAVVVAGVTVRHMVSAITGAATGTSDLFEEYQHRIYLGYRLAGILLFFIITALCYTNLEPSIFFTIGLIIVSIIYLLRVTTLLVIFTSKHISISYLILYLCALEILPVALLFKIVS